jgi:hypothetical protein
VNLVDFANGFGGLLSGIGSCLLGLAALITAVKGMKQKEMKMKNSKGYWFVIGILLIAVSATIFIARAAEQPEPRNAKLTTAAWDALNKADYDKAISTAQKCIDEFKGTADREQARLDSVKAPMPPTGSVSNEQKDAIVARGPLNDVGTCYFIKGRAAENLGHIDVAKAAYTGATNYTYARCWDPKGWFWSPAEASQDRLAAMK